MWLFYIVWFIWVGSEIVLNVFTRSKNFKSRQYDGGTLKQIWITITLSVILAVFVSKSYYFPISKTIPIAFIGLIIIILGLILRFVSILSLGKSFTVDVSVSDEQKIKKDGLYKYVRHPSYLGALLSFLGLGLSINNWISLFLIIIPVTIAFIKRMDKEEATLRSHFGKEYQDYIKKTKHIVPYIY